MGPPPPGGGPTVFFWRYFRALRRQAAGLASSWQYIVMSGGRRSIDGVHSPRVPAGVGRTALGVARIRAAESQRPDRLFDDPLASAFAAAQPDDEAPPGEHADAEPPDPAAPGL